MTYYEELGVQTVASVEEIRHAYRRVARLVHPDHCADEETRRLADLQMKRLNGMLAVLADDAQRARYDLSITCASSGDVPALSQPRGFRPSRQHQQAAGAVVLVLLITLAVWPRRKVTPTPIAYAPLPLSRTARSPKKPASRPVLPLRQPIVSLAPPPVIPEQAPAAPTAEPPLEPVIRPAPPLIPPAVPTPAPTLSGRWLYAVSSSVKHSGYPPEYIEVSLTEGGGVLHGRYRARYRVTDRAISPDVDFRFDGRTGPEGGKLPWDGPNGAKGEVTLRLLPTGSLEVDWVAHQLGQGMALISGTATLVRKIE